MSMMHSRTFSSIFRHSKPISILKMRIIDSPNIKCNNLYSPVTVCSRDKLIKYSNLKGHTYHFNSVCRINSDDSKKDKSTSNNEEFNKKSQSRKANLGSIIDQIKVLVPNILNKSLPKSIISSDISLRICPTHFEEYNSYIPALKGYVSYYTTCKTMQLILTSIVLSPKVKLHIQSIRTSTSNDIQCVNPDATKVYVRWTTCSEGCYHLSPNDAIIENEDTSNYHSTSDAKLGSHRWSKFDTAKIINKDSKNGSITSSIGTTISQLSRGLIGLTREEKKLERVISGIFIFELNSENNKIQVHTIENVDVVERTQTEDIDGELRIC